MARLTTRAEVEGHVKKLYSSIVSVLGRHIPILVDVLGDTSFHDGKRDVISISLGQVNKGLANFNGDDWKRSVLIDTMILHEVGHALCTAVKLMPRAVDLWGDSCVSGIPSTWAVNVFEDGREEYIMSSYFPNTLFEEHVQYVCGGIGDAPTNAQAIFFYAVRFEEGSSYLIRLWRTIRNSFLDVRNRGTPLVRVDEYLDGIREFARACKAEELAIQWWSSVEGMDDDAIANAFQNNGDLGDIESEERPDQLPSQAIISIIAKGGSDTLEKNPATPEPQQDGDGEEVQQDGDGEEVQQEQSGQPGKLPGKARDFFKGELDGDYADHRIRLWLNRLFEDRRKQDSANHQSVFGWSGSFDLLGNLDDPLKRYWRQEARQGVSVGREKVNLILCCDNSGSFCDDAPLVNGLIYEIRRKLPEVADFFDFHLILMGCGERIAAPTEYVEADDGTYLDSEIHDLLKKCKKRDRSWRNIVIGMYDGSENGKDPEAWSAFNNRDTIFIGEDSNADTIGTLTRAKRVITEDYTAEFLKETMKAVEFAFSH